MTTIYFPHGYIVKLDAHCWTVMVPETRKDRETGKPYVDHVAHSYHPRGERGFLGACHSLVQHYGSHHGEVSHRTFLETVRAFRDEYLEMVKELAA